MMDGERKIQSDLPTITFLITRESVVVSRPVRRLDADFPDGL